MEPVTITFPTVGRALSTNQANSMHWAARRRALEPWREGVMYAWRAMRSKPGVKEIVGIPCNIQVHLPFPDNRRRDPSNYVGTVVKAIVDQLVQEGLWPDDDPEYVTVMEPVVIIGDMCSVDLIPREPRG